MSILCFGSFGTAIKNATPRTKIEVVDILVDGIIANHSQTMDNADKYKMLNSKYELQYLREDAGTIGVANSINKYFADKVIPNLTYLKINELIEVIKGLINGDETICETDKKELLLNASKNTLSEFLSTTFLFAAMRPNNLNKNILPTINSNSTITLSNGKIFLNGEEITLPEKLKPPENFDTTEAVYIAEVLKAYAEKLNLPNITTEELPIKYIKELDRHRQDYFNAEAVRRRMRETHIKAESEFESLKKDTYDGVIDTHSMDYITGYERLLNVLQQAVKLQQGKSLLWQLPKMIGASEKKGICHILINDKEITWVVKDE